MMNHLRAGEHARRWSWGAFLRAPHHQMKRKGSRRKRMKNKEMGHPPLLNQSRQGRHKPPLLKKIFGMYWTFLLGWGWGVYKCCAFNTCKLYSRGCVCCASTRVGR
ncbi:hypothetical protein GDO81_025433 [Engystomops pustulosus]|uniref:Uncharacterized protein n=1 Tax=Engystomops pustulosus TaxID=76066 RepID=A0AAV6YJS7_ENGPU|nr:hypothetical protein GDO81_025433 [Engystomops pustulosus]